MPEGSSKLFTVVFSAAVRLQGHAIVGGSSVVAGAPVTRRLVGLTLASGHSSAPQMELTHNAAFQKGWGKRDFGKNVAGSAAFDP